MSQSGTTKRGMRSLLRKLSVRPSKSRHEQDVPPSMLTQPAEIITGPARSEGKVDAASEISSAFPVSETYAAPPVPADLEAGLGPDESAHAGSSTTLNRPPSTVNQDLASSQVAGTPTGEHSLTPVGLSEQYRPGSFSRNEPQSRILRPQRALNHSSPSRKDFRKSAQEEFNAARLRAAGRTASLSSPKSQEPDPATGVLNHSESPDELTSPQSFSERPGQAWQAHATPIGQSSTSSPRRTSPAFLSDTPSTPGSPAPPRMNTPDSPVPRPDSYHSALSSPVIQHNSSPSLGSSAAAVFHPASQTTNATSGTHSFAAPFHAQKTSDTPSISNQIPIERGSESGHQGTSASPPGTELPSLAEAEPNVKRYSLADSTLASTLSNGPAGIHKNIVEGEVPKHEHKHIRHHHFHTHLHHGEKDAKYSHGKAKTDDQVTYARDKSARVHALSVEDVTQTDEELRNDLNEVRHALELFFNSDFDESERILRSKSGYRMYYALGEAFVSFLKACMGFEEEDIEAALSYCKDTMHIVQLVRRGPGISGITGSVAGGISSVGRFMLNGGSGVRATSLVQMSLLQRHAELIYAETLLLRSVLSILASADFLSLMGETLNLRSVYGSYRSLLKFIESAEHDSPPEKPGYGASAASGGAETGRGGMGKLLFGGSHRRQSSMPTHASHASTLSADSRAAQQVVVDEDFRSGVYLGNGLLSMILGMLPGKVLKAFEMVGYSGDCLEGIELLNKPGGWVPDAASGPDGLQGVDWDLTTVDAHAGIGAKQDGLRRMLADQLLCAYHLLFANFAPLPGVDPPLARRIVAFNLQRFPRGLFPRYFISRLLISQAQPAQAIVALNRSLEVQDRYVQFQHMIIWDLCLCRVSLGEWESAQGGFEKLLLQTNWSKCVYNYSVAVCEYEAWASRYVSSHADEELTYPCYEGAPEEIADRMARTPGFSKRLAGKSVPMDKFVVRKVDQFARRGGQLVLAGMELAYILQTFKQTPLYTIQEVNLPRLDRVLRYLKRYQSDPNKYPIPSHREQSRNRASVKGESVGESASESEEEQAYVDDLALALFLRGVSLSTVLWPVKGTVVTRSQKVASPFPSIGDDPLADEEARELLVQEVEVLFHRVIALGPSLTDPYLMYYATFELGNCYAEQGLDEQAREQFNLVVSGKNLGDRRRKGKYSLQTSCMLRSNGALSQLKQREKEKNQTGAKSG